MKTAVIQMSCKSGDKEYNLKKASELIKTAGENGAKIIVLPELFNTGYLTNNKDWELAETPKEDTYKKLSEMAQKYNTSILGGFMEKSHITGLVYNSVMCVSPSGLLGVYRKHYLWGNEKNRFLSGTKFPVFECNKIKTGVQICYEAGFPENARILSMNGAQILCYCAAFGKERFYAWDIGTKARAIENGVYVLAANHSMAEGDIKFCASSRIISPCGELMAEATLEDEIIYACIEIDQVTIQRNAIPYLRDIRNNDISVQYNLVK